MVHKPNTAKGFYGGSVTAPVFKKIADWVYSKTPIPLPKDLVKRNTVAEFKKGDKINVGKSKNTIPNVTGHVGSDVIPVLENLGLDVQYTGFGKVISQSIPAGTRFKKGETIYLMLEG